MPEPTLYAWYSAEEAVSLFGSPDGAQRLCDGQWVIFENTAICLTDVGEKWGSSHFHDAASFYRVANHPYRVSDGPGGGFLPARVRNGSGLNYWIRLFVRPSQAGKYLYAGELAMGHLVLKSINADIGSAQFRLRPALPSKVWVELGGLRLGDLNFAAVDAALDRLRRPTALHDRVSVLQKLVHYWHGPIGLEDGFSEAEMKIFWLPAVLRWWYRWAGKRPEIMSGQNILFRPYGKQGQPVIVDGRLFFYVENQGVYQWATLPDGDDPPVFGRYNDDEPWEREQIRVSEHLILACLFEAVMVRAKYRASAAWLEEEKLAAVVEHVPPIGIAPWRWAGGLRFFAAHGAFICAGVNGEENGKKWYSVYVGAKTEHPLQFLKPLLDKSWAYVAI